MNNLVQQSAPPQQYMVQYRAGNTDIVLDEQTVVNYLVSGKVENVTPQEVVMFMKLCEHQGLNPFLHEAYLVKYGRDNPAQIVVGKSALEKRAYRNQRYKGIIGGIIVVRQDGVIDYRVGEFYLPEERIVGGWAKVFVDGFTNPIESSVSMAEYNSGKSVWTQKPATMIHKVAKVHALREAFPEDMAGMYSAEEVGAYDLPEAPIEPPHGIRADVFPHNAPDGATVGVQNVVEAEIAPPPQEQYEYDEFAELMGG